MQDVSYPDFPGVLPTEDLSQSIVHPFHNVPDTASLYSCNVPLATSRLPGTVVRLRLDTPSAHVSTGLESGK